MRIVLLQNVPDLGQAGETIEVKDGFARNFLIPQKMALSPQDPKAKELVSQISKEKGKKTGAEAALAEKMAALDGKELVFKVKVNKKGLPYFGIQSKEIAEKLGIGEELLDKYSLKTLGEHEIKIKNGRIKIKIVAETAKK